MKVARSVFITGASSGIGAALARHYAATGATLGLAARRGEALQALAVKLDTACHLYPLDVSDAAALQAAGADFIGKAGVPDIVIANAGVSVGTLTEAAEDLQSFRRVLEINVLGMVHTFQPFVAAMKQAGRGRLVGISSVAGIRGLPGAGAYCASKAAAIAYLESLRVELAGTGVKVVTLAPGYIATPMTEKNPYPMPFLMPVDRAAASMARAIERGARFAVMPWQMGLVAGVLKWLPRPLYDRIFSHAGRKPRGTLR
ncbi:SDR family oxidoreductase [Sulfuricystis multivorans]|uniref:SDR family oxidoreductase n=1 Tax=Sulfuricystis multivorans TaxID=2211108 RepID=UPI000F82DABE|nr:SDR family oxidoreductase [Sulfuricystis multivorans]